MRFRSLLVITAIVSSILGAAGVWLVLTVPNDIAAEGLLKDARRSIEAHDNAKARASLTKIVQQYPRTDAAAAATVALVSIGVSERARLEREIATLKTQHARQTRLLGDLQKSVTEIRNAPPKVVTVTAPAPKPVAKKKAPVKKKTPTRRRRR